MIRIPYIHSSFVKIEKVTWALASNLFNSEDEKSLVSLYPQNGFVRCIRDNGPKKHYSFSLQNLVIDNNLDEKAREHVNDIWFNLAKRLLSKEYIKAISQHLKINLTDAFINIGFYKFESNDWVSPHVDNEDKILTQIFYFNSFWATEWGGYFKLLHSQDSNDESFSLPPLSTFSVLLARSESAFHMVTPISQFAKHPRLSMQLEFIRKS